MDDGELLKAVGFGSRLLSVCEKAGCRRSRAFRDVGAGSAPIPVSGSIGDPLLSGAAVNA
jgi:hypothetical protein